MSCCDLSVLDYLRKAAVKLEINQDYGAPDIYGLDEFEITSIIYQYYQVIISYTSFKKMHNMLKLSFIFPSEFIRLFSVCISKYIYIISYLALYKIN